MSISDTDVEYILNKISIKLNKIFCDREFIYSVQEDFKVIFENRKECCVVVFPCMGPHYLKAIQYQAKLLDFSVFIIESGKRSLLAVCEKKFITKNNQTQQLMMPENKGETSQRRKKRPERQLYIPPAQRASPTKSDVKNKTVSVKNSKENLKASPAYNQGNNIQRKELEIKEKQSYFPLELGSDFVWNSYLYLTLKYTVPENVTSFYYKSILQEYINFRPFSKLLEEIPLYLRPYNCSLCILHKNHILWQPKVSTFTKNENIDGIFKNIPLPAYDDAFIKNMASTSNLQISAISFNFSKSFKEIIKTFHISAYCDLFWVQKNLLSESTLISDGYYYIADSNSISKQFYGNTEQDVVVSNKDEITQSSYDHAPLIISEQSVNGKTVLDCKIQKNFKQETNKIDHDEEKEIMRKTKENINRKSRPIMKYVEDTNNTLTIGKDIDSWEELFDEDGQIHDDLLKEIVKKVGKNDVTIVKAKEDYSEYTTKQDEEMEHMVELYDFPPSLETHDLMHAFSEINSDAMYIKWVDDTHAILVLGSLTQAQKAIRMSNAMIKVRPMSAASKTSLSTAYKHDLKPAMKRPQTNLQTARRLITAHLGKKSCVSKEKNIKERDDLKAARELKKLVKKNEQDAWEGNIKSSLPSPK